MEQKAIQGGESGWMDDEEGEEGEEVRNDSVEIHGYTLTQTTQHNIISCSLSIPL